MEVGRIKRSERRTGRPIRKTFPINVMLEEKRVLVVGGGRVGQHKIELLLESGAQIRLVCPTCVEELELMATQGRIEHYKKLFDPSDLKDIELVFACTDDKHVNRAVLDAAREARTLCCCSDGNWADGDFVTPAIIRSGDFLLAVSTNGKSCRQARLIKENLKRHMASIEGADLLILGTSHMFLSAQERAPYHLPLPSREIIGNMIRQIWGVHEFMILNTCNRVELIAVVSRKAGSSGILRRLLRFDRLPLDAYYRKQGFEAFAHLCRVAAGMESQTPGEFHVVAQLKDAASEAETFGWAGPVIHELEDAALHVSKDIRHEVESILDVSEIEDVTLRYLDTQIPKDTHPRVMVIGTGVVGTGLIQGLMKRRHPSIWVYHNRIPEIRPEYSKLIQLISLAEIPDLLQSVDVVVSAVPVETPVISSQQCGSSLNPNGLIMIDLGMPHNIDPALDKGENTVIGLDELKNWFRAGNGSLEKADALCDKVLEEHTEFYERIKASLQGERR